MKTYDEMRARFFEQRAEAKRKFDERVALFKAQWILAIDERIEKAFTSDNPEGEVSVSSNMLEASVIYPGIEGTILEAAEQVRGHYLNLCFDADSPYIYPVGGRLNSCGDIDWVRVTIRWDANIPKA